MQWEFCLNLCLYITHRPDSSGGQKRASDAQEQELGRL